MAYSYANEARMNGDRGSVYKTYSALQAANTQVSYTNSRTPSTVASTSPKVTSPVKEGSCSKIFQKINNGISFSLAAIGSTLGYWGKILVKAKHLLPSDIAYGKSLIRFGTETLGKIAAPVDFVLQLASGENIFRSALKAAAHYGIGAFVGKEVLLVAGGTIGLPASMVILAGAAATVVLSGVADKAIDMAIDWVKEKVSQAKDKLDQFTRDKVDEFFSYLLN